METESPEFDTDGTTQLDSDDSNPDVDNRHPMTSIVMESINCRRRVMTTAMESLRMTPMEISLIVMIQDVTFHWEI